MAHRIKILMIAFLVISGYSCMTTTLLDRNIAGAKTSVYSGKFDHVMMNGAEKKPVEGISVTLKIKQSKIEILTVPSFKAGKMPGKISVMINDMKINENGYFSSFQKDGIRLEMIGFEKAFDAEISGRVCDNDLNFTLKTVNASFLGAGINLETHFSGQRKQ